MATQTTEKYGAISREDVWDALRHLAPRRPADPAPADSAVRWDLVDLDRYRVVSGTRTVGYIEVVGAVFVVLAGDRYDRATEVAQTLVFDRAVRQLTAAA